MVLSQRAVEVREHHPLGASTGCLEAPRGAWELLVDEALAASPFAVELTALSERELPGLIRFLADGPELPFRFVSVHAPTKHRRMTEAELIDALCDLPAWLDAIVVHPDTMEDVGAYRRGGPPPGGGKKDARQESGRAGAPARPGGGPP